MLFSEVSFRPKADCKSLDLLLAAKISGPTVWELATKKDLDFL